ncbi:MAG: radical SAM protein, partial [Vicinamibacterales bacterium]
ACVFAQTTHCVSSDFTTTVTPCQFGGNPDCLNCGCIASAGLEAIGRHRIQGVIPVGRIFHGSVAIGRAVARLRGRGSASAVPPRPSSTPA